MNRYVSVLLSVVVLLAIACQGRVGTEPLTSVGGGLSVAGGTEVPIEDYPYQVYIHIKKKSSTSVCGGSIISEDWVLTAGHCIKKSSAKHVTVRAGSADKRDQKHERKVTQALKHPLYVAGKHNADIALLKVEKPFHFSHKNIQPVKLIGVDDTVPDYSKVYVSGWGHMGENESDKPAFLRAVQTETMPRKVCQKLYGSTFNENMICVGTKDGLRNSCSGDSGGPLVTENKIQIGIVSFGHGCVLPLKPKVYSNVAHLRPWIKKVTGI